ncbi:hypothetical protein M1145_00270 [Patescibacteria group bacterium]|nr:hypothetical protein [Patescibacteria group bacterium]
MKKILIVSEEYDLHVKKVISFIDKYSWSIDVIGIEKLEKEGYIEIFNNTENSFYINKRKIKNYDICWWRKPQYLDRSEKYLKNVNLSNIAEVEKKNFLLGSILNISIKKWVNNILDIQNASYKINQLKVLNSIQNNSLSIPKTIITNRNEIISQYFKNKFIMKSIRSQNFGLEEGLIKSTLTHVEDISKINLNFSPVICQEFIDKVSDIRVTIVGKKYLVQRYILYLKKQK